MVINVFRIDEVNETYDRLVNSGLREIEALDFLLSEFRIKYTFDPRDLKNIPASGPFLTVANHPFGGIDGILLASLFAKVRPDYKLLVNFLLTKIEPISSFFLPVNPFEDRKQAFSSLGGIRTAIRHLREGHPLGVFPAGEVAAIRLPSLNIQEIPYPDGIVKFIQSAQVPVIPIYFTGKNSPLFYALGLLHPRLRTVRLPAELLNKSEQKIEIRIGKPLSFQEIKEVQLPHIAKILRNKIYSLSYRKFQTSETPLPVIDTKDIINPVPTDALVTEISSLQNYHLFTVKDFSVYCAPTSVIPQMMTEISRLREITYREVGEGTGKSFDKDKYDDFYSQLFIWDDTQKKLVGAYRIGMGRYLLQTNGLKGFYIHSLFRIHHKMEPLLNDSLELGRSFVVKEYQKKATPLFLLWKALFVLLINFDYRYLIGPVSISGLYSPEAKALAQHFLYANFYHEKYARFIKNRNSQKLPFPERIDKKAFIQYVQSDFSKLDQFISDFDPSYSTPVLVKQYISLLKTQVLGFNIDPDFNNCLDALMIMDIKNAPRAFMEMLSKDLKDYSKIETLLNELV